MEDSLKGKLTYGTYLRIDELLKLQVEVPENKHHDEMLFIVIHQVYELWFKQILHELKAVIRYLAKDSIFFVIKSLSRVRAIQRTLIQQVEVLETMSPVEFGGFRDKLSPASGFQSYQFRLLEYLCGLKNTEYLKYHKHTPEIYKLLEEALNRPSLYDYILRLLFHRGFSLPKNILERDWRKRYQKDQDVLNVVHQIYSENEKNSDLYYLFENLIDMDAKFQTWRNRHVQMVERMIGDKMGTGGSLGVRYLQTTLDKKFFPELWIVRSMMKNF